MNLEEILLSYNLDLYLDLYEELKEASLYNSILDLNTNSEDLVNIILSNVVYYNTIDDGEDVEDEQIFWDNAR